MSILKNIVPIFLAVSLSACSSPSVTSMNDILGVFDEGENKEIIKEYLLSEGYKCVKPNQKIALTYNRNPSLYLSQKVYYSEMEGLL